MKLYNTLTGSVDEIEPLNPPAVTVYTCGPTVYDYAHIGHWFNYVRMDTLIRALKQSGFKPKWTMNITDVGHLVSDADEGEDKLEKGARREGKTAWEVAEFYTKDFLEGMTLLDIITPDYIVKATDHIPEQIDLIKRLEAKGYTYTIDDGVYFDTSLFEGYAAFARLDLDEHQASARVIANPQKHRQADFALWKFSPKDHKRDMEWDSPWGKGFPGWHIECSAMSMKYLGETLDIHTGGIDHIPVHHTNEIAQSEGATGKRFANYWMHGNHVMVNGEKIAKSTSNGIRLQEIISQGIPPAAVRLQVLESHYRSQSQFSRKSLQAAQNRLKAYQAMADLRFQPLKHNAPSDSSDPVIIYETAYKRILAAMQEDLNSPEALKELSGLESRLSELLVPETALEAHNNFLKQVDALFGLKLSQSLDISPETKKLIAAREYARNNKNWSEADKLRQQIRDQGIEVRDTDGGPIWSRT